MIILVPISRFRVSYDVAMGRPYSRLEALVLRAVGAGATNVNQLEAVFRVHRRLLVEALVTLTQAGWLALGASEDNSILLTSEGQEALQSNESPRSRVVESRLATVIMERVTGACISNDSLRYLSNREIDDRTINGVKLPSSIGVNRLDDASVSDYLPRKKGEWIHWIGPIDQVSKFNHWLPVSIDLSNNELIGLPDEWTYRLSQYILTESSRVKPLLGTKDRNAIIAGYKGRRNLDDPEIPRSPEVTFPATVLAEDILFSQSDHEDLLKKVLSEARTALLVTSAFLSLSSVQSLKGDLLRALQRGVNVDLLWGYSAEKNQSGQDATTWLRELASNTKASGATGVLRLNEVASQSHAKIVLWDDADGFEVCVGSFNWLSASGVRETGSDAGDVVKNVSFRTRVPGIVSRICRRAAVLWDTVRGEIISSTGDRWRQVATELEAISVATALEESDQPNARISVVADRDHEYLLRRSLLNAKRRLVVTTHKLGGIAETRLVSASERERNSGFSLGIRYGESTISDEDVTRIAELIEKSNGTIRQIPQLHAKVLICDEMICISSYNFLSADPYGTSKESRELGIVIEGVDPSRWVWERISSI